VRRLALLGLLALPARSYDLEADAQETLAGFLERVSADLDDDVVVYAPNEGLDAIPFGVPFRYQVARERLVETVGAIFAFFECPMREVGGTRVWQVSLDCPAVYGLDPAGNPLPGRYPIVVAGLGHLELAFSPWVLWRRPELWAQALTRRARDRLLAALHGPHAGARAKAATLLGALGPHDDGTLTSLRVATRDGDGAVRKAAARSLAVAGARR